MSAIPNSQIFQDIKNFIEQNLLEGKILNEDETKKLISSKVIDSFQLLELASFIEEKFQLKIPEKDLTAAKFDSLADLSQWIQSQAK